MQKYPQPPLSRPSSTPHHPIKTLNLVLSAIILHSCKFTKKKRVALFFKYPPLVLTDRSLDGGVVYGYAGS